MTTTPFVPHTFREPPTRFRPWTRWWWPGGDVDLDELIREVRLFAAMHFGGLEIQPCTAGINPETIADHSSGIYAYDSPGYYEKLVAVLEEAKEQGLQIDLTLGSGWPAGGPFVPLEDNVDTLLYGEATVSRAVDMPVPAPIMPFAYAIYSDRSVLPLLTGREWTRTLSYHPDEAQLVAVIAATIVQDGRSPDPSVLTDTVALDISTALDISEHVKDGHVQWQPPSPGPWRIVSIYTMPSGSRTLLSAVAEENYVVDPFDTGAIERYYRNWIGQHPELLAHAGATLRGLFSDSYEFFPQRHYSDDLIELFRNNRGYDVTPFLAAVFQPARDQHFFFFSGLRTAPDFSYGEASERINHDYDLTVSDLFFRHWYAASRGWIEDHDLKFRQQGYNPPLDVIKAAGAASIPETEGGNELMLKRVASGGHLYGKPLVSAESFVFLPEGGFALTPQDYKRGIDLLMTAGVNQIVYHGTPYRWDAPGYGEIGWSPFITPYGGTDITANVSEANPFWKYQLEINRYAARLQLLMQCGRPQADILVYLPLFDSPTDPRFAPVLQTVDAAGYAWEWVNDDLLDGAEWTQAGLIVGDMRFQALILPEVEKIPLATARRIASLAQAGMPVVLYGRLPSRQPGYLNYEENDRLVCDLMRRVGEQQASMLVTEQNSLARALDALPAGPIKYEENPSLRFVRRSLDEGRTLAFIRNTAQEATTFTLHLAPSLRSCFWLETTTGNIYAAEMDGDTVQGWLPGHGSIAIMCAAEPPFEPDQLAQGNPMAFPEVVETVLPVDWRLHICGEDAPGGEFEQSGAVLGDWREREELQATSTPAVYEAAVSLDELQAGKRYVLDLGAVYAAADVTVNGQHAGHAIFSPYRVDVSRYLQSGDNSIRIEVTPSLRNRLVGKALAGDPEYAQFAGRSPFAREGPVASGLVGPVVLQIVAMT